MSNKKNWAKSYVYYPTIRKSVGGGFSNPGESRICKVGKHKVLVTRAKMLDYYGNPLYTAAVINRDGSVGKECKSNGGAAYTVSCALENCGVKTRYRKTKTYGKYRKRK